MISCLIVGDDSRAVVDRLFTCILLNGGGVSPVLSRMLSPDLVLSGDMLAQYTYVYLIPGNVFPALPAGTQRALCEYVDTGGVLVCTPFTAWSAKFGGNRELADVLPVECVGFYEDSIVELQEAPIRIHQGMMETGYAGTSFEASGEDLVVRAGAELICQVGRNGSMLPFLVRRQYGKGYVLYVNAVHHAESREIDIWSPGNTLSPTFHLMESWSFQCALDSDDVRRGTMVRFIRELAQSFLGSATAPAVSPCISPRARPAITPQLMSGIAAHYAEGHTIEELLFPKTNRYAAMSVPEKNIICRALVACSDIFAADGSTELEDYIAQRTIRITNDLKRLYLEKLGTFLFLLADGISVSQTNVRTRTSEIDILLRNRSPEPFWGRLDSVIAVECKNWARSVGAREIRDFHGKLLDLGITTGFFLSASGFSGTGDRDAQLVLRDCRKQGVTIVPLTLSDVRKALKHADPTDVLAAAYESVCYL